MNDDILPLVETPNKLFLEGPFGAGKSTLAIQRLTWLLKQERVLGSDILLLTPQRTLARPFYLAVRRAEIPAGPPVQVTTVASLARRSVQLYWPLVSQPAGFAAPAREPVFLNLETSQYHMGPLVDAAFASGAFQGIRVERNRVISQVLDNLNKAALNGFSIDAAYARLEAAAPPGEQRAASLNALRSAREISYQFREKCLALNLVDFSLQIDIFTRNVLAQEWSRTHLLRSYRHLIFDNVEEDTYSAHHLVEMWLPRLETALLVTDRDGGLRTFLGASPDGVGRLLPLCDHVVHVERTLTMSPPMQTLERTARSILRDGHRPSQPEARAETDDRRTETPANNVEIASNASPLIVPQVNFRFYPQMIKWVAAQVRTLVEQEQVPPGEIVVLAPYMSDALRFSLQTEMAEAGIPSTSHRPSRPLRNEPAARSLLTLAALAHPHWGVTPSRVDIATTFASCLEGADPVRANLLAGTVYRPATGSLELAPFEQLNSTSQQRITYRVGERYDGLRNWIQRYLAEPAVQSLDHFWSRLFGEVLSQPGYTFHGNMDAARVTWQLVTAARNFRWAVEPTLRGTAEDAVRPSDPGKEFCQLVESGAVGALFAGGWEERDDAVLIAPAYTFLMRNRAVDYQFWLDIGSSGWWERLYQPLTHPYVLSRNWSANQPWTDLDEYSARQQTMRRLVLGLLRRTRRGVFLGLSQYSESGYEQRGPLLSFANRLHRAQL